MAELVDAPDSKSGHFGGVGSIPSTPTNKNWPLSNFRFKKVDSWLPCHQPRKLLRILVNHSTTVKTPFLTLS